MDASKAGHGGTLDPLATGILPIAFGVATKTVSFAMDSSKTYRFQVKWGETTATDDREGDIIARAENRPTPADIELMLPSFCGQIRQIPPKYSAIKVSGQRAYDLARADQKVDLAPRTINIDRFVRLELNLGPDYDVFEVDCGKGTYIRALARDLASALGTCGHISELRRTRCGPFDEKVAISLDKLAALGHKAAGSGVLLPVATVLDDIPALALTEEEAHRMCHGQSVSLFSVANRTPISGLTPGTTVQAVCGDRLIALAIVADGLIKPVRVLNN